MTIIDDRLSGCLLGLACGDAVGTTVEFKDRGSFDARDQMERYCRWHQKGYLSSNGTCFDIGGTVQSALRMYRFTDNPFAGCKDEFSAGNGSIMRLAPVPMFYEDWSAAINWSGESSRTTHGAEACVGACRLFGSMLHKALKGCTKDEILFAAHFPKGTSSQLPETIELIAQGSYISKDIDAIQGSGYVVQSLEAALWSFFTTDNFRDAILRAANLGNDADTTAAICGQIAGAYYGASEIPEVWRRRLEKGYLMDSLVEGLIEGRKG